MGNVKKSLSCRKLFNKFKTLVLPCMYLFSLASLVEDKAANFHILKYMLQIQSKHQWLLPGSCAQYYKRTKLYNALLIFKCDEKEVFKPALNIYLLFHSYSVYFFVDWKPICRPTAHTIMLFLIQTVIFLVCLMPYSCTMTINSCTNQVFRIYFYSLVL